MWLSAAVAIGSLAVLSMSVRRGVRGEVGTTSARAERSSRIYVLTDDAAGIPEDIAYDQAIAVGDVPTVFLPGGMPERRVLVVTRAYLEAAEPPPPSNLGGGTTAFYVLMRVLWNGHVLFAVDSNSELIAEHLGMNGTPTPFDPLGRQLPLYTQDENSLLAGTGVRFSVADGWDVQIVESPVGNSPPPSGGWLGSARISAPPHFEVNRILSEMTSGSASDGSGTDCLSKLTNGAPDDPAFANIIKLSSVKFTETDAYKLQLNCQYPLAPDWCDEWNGRRQCCPSEVVEHTVTMWYGVPGCEPRPSVEDRHYFVCEKVHSAGTSADDAPAGPGCAAWLTGARVMLNPPYASTGQYKCSENEPDSWLAYYKVNSRYKPDGDQSAALAEFYPENDIVGPLQPPMTYNLGISGFPPFLMGYLSFATTVPNGITVDVSQTPGFESVTWHYISPDVLDVPMPGADITESALCCCGFKWFDPILLQWVLPPGGIDHDAAGSGTPTYRHTDTVRDMQTLRTTWCFASILSASLQRSFSRL